MWVAVLKRLGITVLEGSQASPARPSDKDSMKMCTLECLEVVAWDGAAEFWFSELIVNYIIWNDNSETFTAEEFNFDEFKSGGLHEKHALATWNLGTIPAFAWRNRKIKKSCVEMAGRRDLGKHTDF
jgi:hypothetical protein